MNKLKIALLFIKKNWKAFAWTLVILVGIIILYLFKNSIKDLLIQKKYIEIAKSNKEKAQLEVRKEIVQAQINHTEEQIKEIDERIGQIDVEIHAARVDISKMTLDEKLGRFDDLGY